MYDMLFSPMNIGTVRIKNRIVMTAAEFSLGEPSGKVTPRLSDYYEERAKGGVGLIIPGICENLKETVGKFLDERKKASRGQRGSCLHHVWNRACHSQLRIPF